METNATQPMPTVCHLALAASAPRAGRRSAALELCAHRPLLEAVALRLCRDQADAHDLVQDTLERALRAQGRLRPGSNLRGWLLSILRNRFLDQCRHGADQRKTSLDDVLEVPAPQPPEEEPGWAAIGSDELRRAVDSLPPQYRCVYEMHALQGMPYQAISATLGIPQNTVGTRLIRARRKLKEKLGAMVSASPQPEKRRLSAVR